jgi:predicted PurR-regulated permease PerM
VGPVVSHRPQGVATGLVVGALAAFCWMVRPVVAPVLVAALFAVVLAPWTGWLAARLGRRARFAPAVATLGSILVILGPVALITFFTLLELRGVEGSGFGRAVRSLASALVLAAQRVGGGLTSLGVDMSTASLRTSLEDGVQGLLVQLGGYAGGALTSAPDLLVAVFLFVIALYFWLRDGASALRALRAALPFQEAEIDLLFGGVRDAARGVLIGQLFTGAVQTLLTLGFLFVLQVPGAFLWGVLAFVLSFIPLFGTTPVTLGAAVYLFTSGRHGAAVAMVVGALVIGAADNLVRPLVASASGNLHPLVTLLAIFGGLAALGASGILFGPIVAAVAAWALGYPARRRAPGG